MILQLDTKVSKDRLSERYNSVRSIINNVIKNPYTIVTKVAPQGRRNRWRSHEESMHLSIINKNLITETTDFLVKFGLIEPNAIIVQEPKIYGDIVICKGFLTLTRWQGCFDEIKNNNDLDPVVKATMLNKIFKFSIIASGLNGNHAYEQAYERYQQMCIEVCPQCKRRFDCSSYVSENKRILGTYNADANRWSNDQIPVDSKSVLNVMNFFSEYSKKVLIVKEDKAINMLSRLEEFDELIKVIVEHPDKFYRNLSEAEKTKLQEYVTPTDNAGAVTRAINEYREKNLCNKCILKDKESCYKQHYYNRSYGNSGTKVKCSFLPITLEECTTIISEDWKSDKTYKANHAAAVHMFKMLRVIDRDAPTTIMHKFGGRRVVSGAVIDYDINDKNFALRARGKFNNTVKIPEDHFLDMIEVEKEKLDTYAKSAEEFKFLHLFYWLYSKWYRLELRKEYDRSVAHCGHTCAPIRFGISQEPGLEYKFEYRYISKYDRVTSNGVGMHIYEPLMFRSILGIGGEYSLEFVKIIEDKLARLKDKNPIITSLHKKYHELRGEEIRKVKVYKKG